MRTRISHQLIFAVALTAEVIFGLLSSLLITSHRRSTVTIMESSASESAETIQRSTRFAMLQNQPSEVRQSIDRAPFDAGWLAKIVHTDLMRELNTTSQLPDLDGERSSVS